ncbi:MAG: hypothetical protein HYT88_00705 [Candidatus Omnitrophica bacterium]|nr:hypothetical protein [Candidatus Omnitrophota bacterium]MBI2173572.1 hypothetical protein [Candidatus Omnitrophota bacterium]
MPLSPSDRRFLRAIENLKIYILVLALTVFVSLLLAPPSEIQLTTSLIGIALCGVFWLTQKLLNFISLLDLELTRLINALKRTLPKEKQHEYFN